MSGNMRTCQRCGRTFFGWTTRQLCQSCAGGKKQDDSKERELSDEREGWRHMLRDATGTVIVPGGNVISALDELCAYEEACEAAGIHGPEALKKCLKDRTISTGTLQDNQQEPELQAPRVKRPRWHSGEFCEDCALFKPTTPSGGHGICKLHKRRIRPEGGKGNKYVELDEPRQVAARRVACGDWIDKDNSPPQWGGPSAELLREEIGKERTDGTRKT